jgi:hypothetical protein
LQLPLAKDLIQVREGLRNNDFFPLIVLVNVICDVEVDCLEWGLEVLGERVLEGVDVSHESKDPLPKFFLKEIACLSKHLHGLRKHSCVYAELLQELAVALRVFAHQLVTVAINHFEALRGVASIPLRFLLLPDLQVLLYDTSKFVDQ